MDFIMDKKHIGIRYSMKHLLHAYGVSNCYVLGNEIYAMTNVNGLIMASFYKLEDCECIKTSRPSKLLLACAYHEALWIQYEYWFSKRTFEPREPTESEMVTSRRKHYRMPLNEVAPREYGKVEYLVHVVSGKLHNATQ